jgi:glycosyltransferase involved in cell wall biosynthesis
MGLSSMKKLTIGIPTYNRKDALFNLVSELTLAIQGQSLDHSIELLVVDNCSTTHDVFFLLSEQLKNYSFLKVKSNPANIGAGANFLRVIESASGEYVWLLGDDERADLSQLKDLLSQLEQERSLYLLPHNKSYAVKSDYYGNFESHADLFKNFWNLGSFFVLSIYVFNRSSTLSFIKIGYENVRTQHPYCAIALQLLSKNYVVELINIPILKIQSSNISRFDKLTAVVDIIEMMSLNTNTSDFEIYIENDFYKLRESDFFTLNIGLVDKVDLDSHLKNFMRLIKIMPFCSRASLKARLWIFLTHLRRFNGFVSFLLYALSKVKKNKFSGMSYKDIYIKIYSNLVEKKEIRH